tara:strand:- start:7058 stop:7414 length:357 start_codon:yes stop_codon:yes gene_type:complete
MASLYNTGKQTLESSTTTDTITGWKSKTSVSDSYQSITTFGNINNLTYTDTSTSNWSTSSKDGTSVYWNNDNEEIIDYLLFLSEALNLDIPNFDEFKNLSKEDRHVKLREIKINNILE